MVRAATSDTYFSNQGVAHLWSGVAELGAFSSLSMILGECSIIHSSLVLLFIFFFFFEVEISSRTLIPLYARLSPQWLSELRRLWPNVP